jgi:hypothetical protein
VLSTTLPPGKGYCRKCQKIVTGKAFFDSVDTKLDSNGLMSVCKNCCNNICNEYKFLHKDDRIALKYTCRDLNVLFDESIFQITQKYRQTVAKRSVNGEVNLFSTYKGKLSSIGVFNKNITTIDGSFDNEIITEVDPDIPKELVLFWGKGFNREDIESLQYKYEEWTKTTKSDTQSEKILLREICIKLWEMEVKRQNKLPTTKDDLKDLQDLMKTESVDPAKANVASAGKSLDAYGVWIKDIEQYRPCEWFDQQEKYKDMDGFSLYIYNYVTRPIRNFIKGVRDFVLKDKYEDIQDVSYEEGDS